MDWRHFAACRDIDPEVFFPFPGDTDGQDAARAICSGCPVRSDCLNWALATGRDHGVWGGLTEDERRALRRSSFVPRKVCVPVPKVRKARSPR